MQKSAWLYVLIAFLVVAGAALAVWWPTRNQTANNEVLNEDTQVLQPQSQPVTMTGSYECLPHRDTSGPQTLECAFGLLMGDTYYAIDTSQVGNNVLTTLNTGDQITVSGELTQAEDLDPESRLLIYDIAGVIQASAIAAVDNDLASPTASPDVEEDEPMMSPSPLASPTTNVPDQLQQPGAMSPSPTPLQLQQPN